MNRRLALGSSGALAAALALGCGSSSSSATPVPPHDGGADVSVEPMEASTRVYPDAGALGGYDPTPFGGNRPTKLYVPSGYVPGKPAPLLVLLHGYGASGAEEDFYLGLKAAAEAANVLYVHPDGTFDAMGSRFWNATDACCNFYGSQVDDEGYLVGLVAEIAKRYDVDAKRVYFFGHSNGAFMSYRMACHQAGTVAAIAALAGDTWLDPSLCKPSVPVTVLHVQGTADMTILYGGGMTVPMGADGGPTSAGTGGTYPGALTSVADWVGYDGCSTTSKSLPNIDIEGSLPGAETQVTQYATGCKNSSEVDLWSIQGGAHIPNFNANFCPDVLKFLLAHPKG